MSLPPVEIPLGAMRFNSDSYKLEYWNGGVWMQVHTFSPNLDGGVRGVYAGGQDGPPGPATNEIQFFTISTQGNAADFGDLTRERNPASMGSNVRGVFASGSPGQGPYYTNEMDFITLASTGNATDFGDNNENVSGPTGLSNATRGLICNTERSGASANNTISMITISQTGNAVDYGDLTEARNNIRGACASPTRGLVFGGMNPSITSTIDLITIPLLLLDELIKA